MIFAADLFCGAGGTSTGLIQAAQALGLDVNLLAINHWNLAIATHSANHPGVEHRCEDLDNVNPRKVVPGGYLDLLVASPECMSHSRARGGTPKNDQSRATAFHVLRWAEALYVKDILIENVPEFTRWGPLDKDGEPIKRLEGQVFLSFIHTLESLGYNVDWRLINCADFGDPTTRERLFIQARREKPVSWPEPSHGAVDMFEQRRPYHTAREIIDWTIKAESIFSRKRPLKPNTMRRIAKGLQKFSGLPFITSTGGPVGQGRNPKGMDEPISTILSDDHHALVEPFLVMFYGQGNARSVDIPMPVVTAQGEHIGLCEPFLVEYHGDSGNNERVREVDKPLPTVDTSNR
jgi:DNA (cytosine-5)-methyltransferase 1